MATNLTVILRSAGANCVDDITRLQAKLGITGTVGAIYTAVVATQDDDRRDAILNSLNGDPNIVGAAYQ